MNLSTILSVHNFVPPSQPPPSSAKHPLSSVHPSLTKMARDHWVPASETFHQNVPLFKARGLPIPQACLYSCLTYAYLCRLKSSWFSGLVHLVLKPSWFALNEEYQEQTNVVGGGGRPSPQTNQSWLRGEPTKIFYQTCSTSRFISNLAACLWLWAH